MVGKKRCGIDDAQPQYRNRLSISNDVPKHADTTPRRRHPIRLRRPDRKQQAADCTAGTGGARALLEWFVRLRFPGYESTRISDRVPKGWKRATLENIGHLKYGRALKAEDRIDGDYPVYGSSGIVGTHDTPHVRGPGIIVGRKGNVGSVYWSEDDFYAIDTVYYVEPSAVTLYLYYALKNMDFINTDVAVPGLNRNFAHSRELLLPSVAVQEAFNEIAETEHKQIALLRKENNSLEYARDLLLPRLMSVEVAV